MQLLRVFVENAITLSVVPESVCVAALFFVLLQLYLCTYIL